MLQAKAEPSSALGIYLHVPFCAHTCDFCAFYQEAPDRLGIERYLKTLEAEINALPPPRPVDTVFFGGGTPGLLLPKDLLRIGRMLEPFVRKGEVEWTVEMAPSTVKPAKIEALIEMGVNRISLGIQSFQPRMLEALGRRHDVRQIYRAIDDLRSGGIRNLNFDMIFAIPGQTRADWEEDLATLIRAQPEHVSTYCLTFEEDTVLWTRLQRGNVSKLTEEEEVGFYQSTWQVLGQAGYRQYEVSNFARPGFECRHNCDTWRMQEWIGYGPSASSQFKGKRYTNTPDLTAWQEGIRMGKPHHIDVVSLNAALLATDALIFGLRMNQGVSVKALKERFPEAPWQAYQELAEDLSEEGLISIAGNFWSLTDTGRLVADGVGGCFLELTP